MTASRASEIEQAKALLPDIPQLIAQCLEWADSGIKGQDPSKPHVAGGDRVDPTARAALTATTADPWRQTADMLAALAKIVRHADLLTDLGYTVAPAAERLLRLSRTVTDRWVQIDDRTRRQLDATNQASSAGACHWCGRECRGARAPGPDGTLVDDRRRPIVVSDREFVGLCNACHSFLVRRTLDGVAMSDVAHLDAIRAEREQALAPKGPK